MSVAQVDFTIPDSPQSTPAVREGSLLLWLSGNKIYALNGTGEIIWEKLEESPARRSVEELVDYLEEYFSGSGVERKRLHSDVDRLVTELAAFGLLDRAPGRNSPTRYRIKDDVFRAQGGGSPQQFIDGADPALSYRPTLPPVTSLLRGSLDTGLGLIAIITYELVLRLRGFARLCVIVERWPLSGGNKLEPLRVRQICAGVDRARLWYPKKVQCLQHSAVVTCLLRRVGVPAKMVFAARKTPFYAHAWSQVGETVVNDEQGVRARYSIFRRCLESK